MAKALVQRDTRQKRAIRDVFASSERPLAPHEVYAVAQGKVAGLGIATVYRSIRMLRDDGWLTEIEVPGKGTLYEVAGKEHHHHFSCTQCHRVYELEGCSIAARVPRNFRATGHDLTIYGFCSHCRAPRSASRATTARR